MATKPTEPNKPQARRGRPRKNPVNTPAQIADVKKPRAHQPVAKFNAVAPRRSKTAVIDQPASDAEAQLENALLLLNRSYDESRKEREKLQLDNSELHERLNNHRLEIRANANKIISLEHVVANLQSAEINRSIRESKGWFTRLRGSK